MSTILLDTNIVSFIFKGDSRALDYEIHLKNRHLAIAFMTVAELYQWAAIRQWGERRKSQLLETLQERYILLSFNVLICQQWGTLRPILLRSARKVP
ncbi:MAG: type II toxin-antitoxin system VapC family toxin, partial [Moorea sp. SIO3C2]|nr:type II toxin-antitoxin system VapC family toxin [Moorena sp. SIO3C2]